MVRGRATARGARRGAASAAASSAADENGTTAPASAAADSTPASLDNAPASDSNTGAVPPPTARRGGATTGTRGNGGGRLRPNFRRRDEAERDKRAREEEQKAAKRAAEERRARGRSRARSKRSRGDAMGSRGGRGGITTASGPFSGGAAASGGSRSGGGGWFGGGSGNAPRGGSYGGSRSAKSDSKVKAGFSQAEVRNRETRINADKLHVISPDEELDSDDEAMMEALDGRSATTMPMGIYRREHMEQGVVVATTAELEAAENDTGEEESLWVEGDEAPIDQPEEGVWQTGSRKSVRIKKEPGNDDAMDLDADAKPAPDQLSKTDKKTVSSNVKPRKDKAANSEEKAIQHDLEMLASELGTITVTDESGETRTEGPANKDGRLYLFQFPPLIPPLEQTAAAKGAPKVKEEPRSANVMDAPVSGDGMAVGLTQDGSIAVDDAAEDEVDLDDQESQGFRSQLLSQGGLVGRLNVRKSGKVELDWGGTTLEMSPAAGMGFQTTAVIVEQNDEKSQQGVNGGDSVGMGKIMGRFVLAPIWDEEEDWTVAPEDLVAD